MTKRCLSYTLSEGEKFKGDLVRYGLMAGLSKIDITRIFCRQMAHAQRAAELGYPICLEIELRQNNPLSEEVVLERVGFTNLETPTQSNWRNLARIYLAPGCPSEDDLNATEELIERFGRKRVTGR